ncbi:MAG: hypothetical protein E6Q97_16120 [Desulfurellales bacterium]|nr:MAG: hypothetical protein E6Q97_16120 [Desulfurellales bacterium]
MTTLTQINPIANGKLWSGSPVQFSDETYGEVTDGLLTIRKGQRTGADDDWGGQIMGSVELDKAIALLKAVLAVQEDAEFAAMIARWEAQQDARHDATSAHWGWD